MRSITGYITLAPVASLGVAFRWRIRRGSWARTSTAASPWHSPPARGETGRRHDPLGVKFINGPTTGRDVFVPSITSSGADRSATAGA